MLPSPVTATTDFLAQDILNKWGRAVPALWGALHSTLTTILRRDRHPSTFPASPRTASRRPSCGADIERNLGYGINQQLAKPQGSVGMPWKIERKHDHVAVVTMNTNKVNAQNPRSLPIFMPRLIASKPSSMTVPSS